MDASTDASTGASTDASPAHRCSRFARDQSCERAGGTRPGRVIHRPTLPYPTLPYPTLPCVLPCALWQRCGVTRSRGSTGAAASCASSCTGRGAWPAPALPRARRKGARYGVHRAPCGICKSVTCRRKVYHCAALPKLRLIDFNCSQGVLPGARGDRDRAARQEPLGGDGCGPCLTSATSLRNEMHMPLKTNFVHQKRQPRSEPPYTGAAKGAARYLYNI